MISTVAAFVKTITGKTVLGLAVATTTAGAAAAAGAPIPVLGEPLADGDAVETDVDADLEVDGAGTEMGDADAEGDESTEIVGDVGPIDDEEMVEDEEPKNHGAVVSAFARTTELEGCARGQAVAGVARGDLDPQSASFDDDLAALVEARCDDEDDEAADDEEMVEDEEPKNHGAVVSAFARTTELEGCARGQAVAGVARGDLDPQSASFDDEMAVFLEDRCGGGDKAGTNDRPGRPSGPQDRDDAPGRSGSAPGRNR